MPTKRHISLLFVTLMIFTLTQMITVAQDEPPAPQFLYRSENHLIILDGYTGKISILPIKLNERDHFEWSPDGKFLLTQQSDGDKVRFCLNLFDVDNQRWIQEKPIACDAQDFLFTDEGSQLYYSSNSETKGMLWRYNISDKTNEELYQTDTAANYSDGIHGLKWSRNRTYITFKNYHWIMGGTLNKLVILNLENNKYATISAPETYYADYSPIWSADDNWFLVVLQEEYITSFSLPTSNHRGDLYLVNPETGKQYRITYTPAESEIGIHWTDDNRIAFIEVAEQQFTYTPDQAMNIEVVSPDKIITPEPIEFEPSYRDSETIISPDPNVGAWVKQTQQPDNTLTFALVIGDVSDVSSDGKFTIPISDPYQSSSGAVLIGWRPSNYPYPQG